MSTVTRRATYDDFVRLIGANGTRKAGRSLIIHLRKRRTLSRPAAQIRLIGMDFTTPASMSDYPSRLPVTGADGPFPSSFATSYAGVVSFLAVVNAGSFARAADRLGIGCSSVSRNARKLEAQLTTHASRMARLRR